METRGGPRLLRERISPQGRGNYPLHPPRPDQAGLASPPQGSGCHRLRHQVAQTTDLNGAISAAEDLFHDLKAEQRLGLDVKVSGNLRFKDFWKRFYDVHQSGLSVHRHVCIEASPTSISFPISANSASPTCQTPSSSSTPFSTAWRSANVRYLMQALSVAAAS